MVFKTFLLCKVSRKTNRLHFYRAVKSVSRGTWCVDCVYFGMSAEVDKVGVAKKKRFHVKQGVLSVFFFERCRVCE